MGVVSGVKGIIDFIYEKYTQKKKKKKILNEKGITFFLKTVYSKIDVPKI